MIRNSRTQNGSVFVAIIIVFLVALFGALGYVFWQNFISKNESDQKNQSSVTTEVSIHKKEEATEIDSSIHDVEIKMQSISDINKLPDYTPSSFVSYMQNLLANNTGGPGMFDCGMAVVQYQVSRISQVNIEGGVVPINEQGQTCAGGAPTIWVLTPVGTWDQETRNGILCKSKNGGLVFEEFAPECYLESTNSLIKNPNGTIASSNR